MCNVCIFRNVKEVLVRDVNTPRHPPPPWWSYDSMRNVCIFRNLKEVLVKNVNTPPHPHPHPPWWSYDSMCNMLKTQKNQILYPHFRKPHFWNLQPFQGIVNGTSQNWQPFQGRRISRMPKTTLRHAQMLHCAGILTYKNWVIFGVNDAGKYSSTMEYLGWPAGSMTRTRSIVSALRVPGSWLPPDMGPITGKAGLRWILWKVTHWDIGSSLFSV